MDVIERIERGELILTIKPINNNLWENMWDMQLTPAELLRLVKLGRAAENKKPECFILCDCGGDPSGKSKYASSEHCRNIDGDDGRCFKSKILCCMFKEPPDLRAGGDNHGL